MFSVIPCSNDYFCLISDSAKWFCLLRLSLNFQGYKIFRSVTIVTIVLWSLSTVGCFSNPNGDSVPEWPPFTKNESRYVRMNGGDDFEVKTTLRAKYCKEWEEIGRKINTQIPVK